MKQNRWKSKVLWASVAAQVLVLLQLTGAFQAMGIDAGVAGQIVAVVLGMLSTFGILNNPTDKESF